MKFVDYCESNKHMRWVRVLRISMRPCKLQGRTAGFQGNLDKHVKMSVKEHKAKNACGYKMPTQDRSARDNRKENVNEEQQQNEEQPQIKTQQQNEGQK